MRPLSSYRIKTGMQLRPKSRMNTSLSAGQKTTSRPSSSFSPRPNSDHLTDLSSDASHLTVGPALQGSLLRSLLARKKKSITNPEKPESTDSVSYKTVIKSIEDNEKVNQINDLKIENKELRDEIIRWRKEHTK